MDVSYISLGVIAVTLKWLLTYAAKRYQLIETARIDLDNRIHHLINEFYVINIWFQDRTNRKRLTEPPVGTENFTFFENAEKDLAYVLWPKEEQCLRYVYRHIHVAESVRDDFVSLVEELNEKFRNKENIDEEHYIQRIRHKVRGFNYCLASALRLPRTEDLEKSIDTAFETMKQNPVQWNNVEYTISLERPFSNYIFIKKFPVYCTFVLTPIFSSLIILGYFFFPDFIVYQFVKTAVPQSDSNALTQARTVLVLFISGATLNLTVFYLVCIKTLGVFLPRQHTQKILFRWKKKTENITFATLQPDKTLT